MVFSAVLVYAEPRSANQDLRRSIFRSSRRSAFTPSASRDEKPVTPNPLIPADYKCPLAQLLSLHILTNARGVWGSTLPFLKFYLNSGLTYRALCSLFAQKLPPFSPFVFKSFRTLSFSVSRKSCICHSYENCRVCANNSHSGSPRALSAKGTPCRLVTSLPRYFLTSLSHQSRVTNYGTTGTTSAEGWALS
jgi:hypothetical protein